MNQINVFGGNGFIGGRYCELTPNVIKNERCDYSIKCNKVLYFISTIHNFHVHEDPFIDIKTNLILLMETLNSCKPEDRKNLEFNFVSSWFVYGDVDCPAKEDSVCNPKGFYSITKRTAEQLLISYCETFGIKYRIFRLSNVLGNQDKKVSTKKNALQYMIRQIQDDKDVNLYGGDSLFRDYLYVDDIVTGINLLLEKGEFGTIYNIGSGIKTRMIDIFNMVIQKTGSKSKINLVPVQPIQVKNMVLDVSKIKALGFQPKFEMEKIVDILISNTNKENIYE